MYTTYYGFSEKPFNIVSDPGFLYMSAKHKMALNYLEYGLMDGIGFILLTGEIGTGKTTLIKHLVQKSREEHDLEVAVVFNTNVSAEQLLELVLEELELERPTGGKSSYLDQLNQYLISKHAQGQRVLLIIDEAQNLSRDALEEVRMLSNLQTDKSSLIQILLVGQPNLRDTMQHPSLRQLRQRVAVSYHLHPLNLEETKNYIVHRLKVSGGNNETLFTAEALEKIYDYTEGVPRSINILCDAALVYGFAEKAEVLDAPVIDEVIEDNKNMGSFGVAPGSENNASEEKLTGDQIDLLARIENLEQQIFRISEVVHWQAEKLESRAESYKDVLVERLTSMLQKEKKRADEIAARYHVLKGRIQQKMIHQENEKGKKADGRGEKNTVDTSLGNDQVQSDGTPSVFRRWFGN